MKCGPGERSKSRRLLIYSHIRLLWQLIMISYTEKRTRPSSKQHYQTVQVHDALIAPPSTKFCFSSPVWNRSSNGLRKTCASCPASCCESSPYKLIYPHTLSHTGLSMIESWNYSIASFPSSSVKLIEEAKEEEPSFAKFSYFLTQHFTIRAQWDTQYGAPFFFLCSFGVYGEPRKSVSTHSVHCWYKHECNYKQPHCVWNILQGLQEFIISIEGSYLLRIINPIVNLII